jgi:hypothetical protein
VGDFTDKALTEEAAEVIMPVPAAAKRTPVTPFSDEKKFKLMNHQHQTPNG